MTVSLVPFGDSFYVSEARQVKDQRARYGAAPVGLSAQAYLATDYLKLLASRRRYTSMLEMGSGIGAVALELRHLIPERVGVELHVRGVRFSEANRRLKKDERVRFLQSDLFASVTGRFDLIYFNPWQPSESALELIVRFLEEARSFLSDEGEIVLLVATLTIGGEDAAMAEISRALHRVSMAGDREVVFSYPERGGGVRALSFLHLRRLSAEGRLTAGEIRTKFRPAQWVYLVRCLRSRLAEHSH